MKALLPRARAARLATRLLPNEDPEFQIAPMIDILLVLLVFFMAIATDQVARTNDGVMLPTAKLASDDGFSSESIVSLHWSADGVTATSVDHAGFMDNPSLAAYLKNRQSQVGDPYRVIIRADRRVPYRDVRAAMSVLGKAGLPNVIFSVAQPENP